VSCLQSYCLNQECKWNELGNKLYDDCPICKSPIRWFFDEPESDRGDDYSNEEDDE